MNAEITILELLSTYTYLSLSQLKYLGVPGSNKTMYAMLGRLRQPGNELIGTRSFRYHPKYGSLEDIHFLKPKGRSYLMQFRGYLKSDISIPIGSSSFYNDYVHRKRTIRIHIWLRQHLKSIQWGISAYYNYFNGLPKISGKGRASSTKITTHNSFLRADSICLIKGGVRNAIYCIELHNGFDVKRLCKQLEQYVQALSIGSPSAKFGSSIGSRVLVITEHKSTLLNAIEKISAQPLYSNMKDYFLFKHFDDLEQDALHNRIDLNKQYHSLID